MPPHDGGLPLFPPDSSHPVAEFKALLEDLLQGYRFDVEGLLRTGGAIWPLPSESSVMGKIIEMTITEHIQRTLLLHHDVNMIPAGSTRTYPDLTFRGSRLFPSVFAVDIKCARRKSATQLKSAIAIGTYDAEYFHYPSEKVAFIEAPYGSYTAHIAMIAVYDYVDVTARNVEVLIGEKWRLARRTEASGSRSYIATSTRIEDLRAERGEFSSEEEFNRYWREQPVKPEKLRRWQEKRQGR